MPTSARRISTFGTTVFSEINMLAQQYDALNLGQGKPDFDTPSDIVTQLVQAAQAGLYNQYAPGPGTASLRQAIAGHVVLAQVVDVDGEPRAAGGDELAQCQQLGCALLEPWCTTKGTRQMRRILAGEEG